MAANLLKLLSEGKTYLWALRHAQTKDLTPEKIKEIKDALAADSIDLTTLIALRQLENSIARFPYPSVQHAHHKEYYFFPIPAFNIEIFFKTMICEQGVEVGMELFPSYVDWQFSHNEIQYCISGDTIVDMVLPNNKEMSRLVRVGDVVAVPVGTNFMTHSSEEGGRFGHAHIFLTNVGDKKSEIFYDVGGLLRLQSLGMVEPAPPGAVPFSDITDRIQVKDWSELLSVDKDRERDLPSWLRNGWKGREETRALDYAEGTKTVVISSPDREPKDFIEWGKGKCRCFVNPLIAEQTAAITDCRFPAGYKRLHPHKEIWVVLKGQGKIKQSIPPLHSEWVE
ncbi:MAG: cupin domain-containing protein, partial [Pseudomonadota bacterium]